MANELEALPKRVEVVERKLDALSVSMEKRFDAVDERFDAVDKRFDAVDRRFEAADIAVNEQFTEQRQYTEFAFERLDRRLDRIEHHVADGAQRLERLERKLDQFIDLQSPPPRSRPSNTP